MSNDAIQLNLPHTRRAITQWRNARSSVGQWQMRIFRPKMIAAVFAQASALRMSPVCVAEKMAELNRNTRLVFDYLKMTKNSTRQVCT
jgi:hypothetical protein